MTDLTVSKTILAQLGSNRFVAMTGAKNFLGDANSLSFKVGSNAQGVTHVRVVLDASDTYTMEFLRIRGTSRKELAKREGICHDQLNQVFERHTGLATRL